MMETFPFLRRAAALLALPALLLAGCDEDSTGPTPPPGDIEAAVVLSSVDRSLTVIPVDDASGTYTFGVAPEGTPASLAARGGVAVIPLGTYPFVAVVDLVGRSVTHTVALPENSGATGAAFLNDSVALVANPDRNSVTPVNVRRGTAGAEIPVGVYPHKIVAQGGRAYVLNGNLVDFAPAGPGSVTVIDGSLAPAATIELSGLNPGNASFGPDGRLYVVNSGSFGANEGSLSVVDLSSLREVSHHEGFGDFPGGVAASRERVLVALYGLGLVEWDPSTRAFLHGLDSPLTPGDIPPVADVGFDSEGRLFALNPGSCDAPGTAYRLSAAVEVEQRASTGICPFSLVFTRLPGS